MSIYIPYFYVIQEVATGMYYAGAKWGKDANPRNFMIKDGYTTSSSEINGLIEQNGLESFIIRKIRTFKTGEEAHHFETRFLQKIDARNHSLFYNTHNNDYRENMIKVHGVENISFSKIICEKRGKSISKRKSDPKWKETKGREASIALSKTLNSEEWKETKGKQKSKKISKIAKTRTGDKNPNYGNKWSEEKKRKFGDNRKGNLSPIKGSRWASNPNTHEVIKLQENEPLPNGYIYGRIKKSQIEKTEKLREEFLTSGMNRKEFATFMNMNYTTLKKYLKGL